MSNRILFIIVLFTFFSFFNSCEGRDNDEKKIERAKIIIKQNIYIPKGYYLFNDNLIYINMENESIVIQDFDIVDGNEMYNELVTFNLFDGDISYESTRPFYEVNYWNSVTTLTINKTDQVYNEISYEVIDLGVISNRITFHLHNGDYFFSKLNNRSYNDEIRFFKTSDNRQGDFIFLSNKIDFDIIKYTYDYNNQYTGISINNLDGTWESAAGEEFVFDKGKFEVNFNSIPNMKGGYFTSDNKLNLEITHLYGQILRGKHEHRWYSKEEITKIFNDPKDMYYEISWDYFIVEDSLLIMVEDRLERYYNK